MNYKGIMLALFCTFNTTHLPPAFHPLVANKVIFIISKPVFSQYRPPALESFLECVHYHADTASLNFVLKVNVKR